MAASMNKISKSRVKSKDDQPYTVGTTYLVHGPNSMKKKMIFNGTDFVDPDEYHASQSGVKRKEPEDQATTSQKLDLFDKMGQEMTCPVCLDFFTDPVMLSCSHSLCRKCLLGIFETHHINRGVECPNCRKRLKVSKYEVPDLPQNLILKNTIGHYQQLMKEKKEKMKSSSMCVHHKMQEVTMFCNHCEVLICHLCLCCDGPHEGHKALPGETAYQKFKDKFTGMKTTLMEAIQNAKIQVEAAETLMLQNRISTEFLYESFQRKINNHYEEIIRKFEEEKNDYLDELEEKSDHVLAKIKAPLVEHASALREARNVLGVYQKIVNNGGDRQKIMERVKDISKLTAELGQIQERLSKSTSAVQKSPEDVEIQNEFHSFQNWVFEMENKFPKLWLKNIFGSQYRGDSESETEDDSTFNSSQEHYVDGDNANKTGVNETCQSENGTGEIRTPENKQDRTLEHIVPETSSNDGMLGSENGRSDDGRRDDELHTSDFECDSDNEINYEDTTDFESDNNEINDNDNEINESDNERNDSDNDVNNEINESDNGVNNEINESDNGVNNEINESDNEINNENYESDNDFNNESDNEMNDEIHESDNEVNNELDESNNETHELHECDNENSGEIERDNCERPNEDNTVCNKNGETDHTNRDNEIDKNSNEHNHVNSDTYISQCLNVNRKNNNFNLTKPTSNDVVNVGEVDNEIVHVANNSATCTNVDIHS